MIMPFPVSAGRAGKIQRQRLPQLLSSSGEEIGKFVGSGTEIADAEATG
jgi:hypothetical protein